MYIYKGYNSYIFFKFSNKNIYKNEYGLQPMSFLTRNRFQKASNL